MTSKLPINLENLLRQRQVEGERIEYKAGWNPDAISLRQWRSVLQPRVARHALPWVMPPHTIQPQRGCAPCDTHTIPTDGTALRFNILNTHSQGRPHCIRATLGWRTKSRWDRYELAGASGPPIGAGLDEKLDELDLTEGRSTGISKIIKAMAANGSPAPEFETDEDRSYFLIRLPVHEKAANRRSPAGTKFGEMFGEKFGEDRRLAARISSGDHRRNGDEFGLIHPGNREATRKTQGFRPSQTRWTRQPWPLGGQSAGERAVEDRSCDQSCNRSSNRSCHGPSHPRSRGRRRFGENVGENVGENYPENHRADFGERPNHHRDRLKG